MSDPSVISNLAKAADIAKSVSTKTLNNVPMILALCFISAVLGFASEAFLPKEWAMYKGVFLSLSIFLGVYTLLQWWFAWRPFRYLKWHCKNLASDERAILVAYLKEDASCEYFSAFHGPVCSLIAKRILSFASGVFDAREAPVMIDPYIRVYLRKHPEILGLKASELGTEKPRGRLKTKSLIPEE
jgi:hypothetical protein